MIQIRRGVFETNSSSTHSLTIWESTELTPEQEKRLQECEYIIKPIVSKWSTNESDAERDDLEGKLTYLWTLLLQANLDWERTNHYLKVLQEAVPNVKFTIIPRDNIYIYEDGDYGFDNWGKDGDLDPWFKNPNLLKAFLINGEVHQWNRDREDAEDKSWEDDKALERISWCG